MAIFGWLILLLITLISTVWCMAAAYGCLALTGKIKGALILFAVPALLWWATVVNFPFVMAVK